ncbi:MAG: DNA (cytosine-5-)-methyltransferase [Deinococcales bacterium]
MGSQQNSVSKDLKVLSLFSGCGGMDLGFEGGFKALAKSLNPHIYPDWQDKTQTPWLQLPPTRFKTIFANDIFPAARAAWLPYFASEGQKQNTFKLQSIVDLVKEHHQGNPVFPKADVVTGGFPCQDFSVAGKRKGFHSHKSHKGFKLETSSETREIATEENRGKLYMWMKYVIEIVQPRVFIAENVKGLVSLADAKAIIENDFRQIAGGYILTEAKVLAAPDYGIAQSRERVIFIGFRQDALRPRAIEALLNGTLDPYPPITHRPNYPLLNLDCLKPYVTVRDYLADLPEPEEAQDPSQQAYSKAKWYGKHCQGQSEVALSGLGPTIRAEHHGNIEFRRLSVEHGGKYTDELQSGLAERRLTVRECARLQTFPDDFEFVRTASELGTDFKISPSEAYKLIGNAVPPLLAFHIAWRLQELWPLIMKEASCDHL